MARKKLKKIERSTESVPLFTNADRIRLGELMDALQEAMVASGPKRVTDAPVASAAAAHDEFQAEALTRAEMVQITALREPEWRQMLADYPPRRDVVDQDGEVIESFAQDQEHGFNIELMSRPLVTASIDLDQFDSEVERQEWVDDLDSPRFARLFGRAVNINEGGVPDPKFSASSWIALRSVAMSRLPDPSAEGSTSSTASPERVANSSDTNG